MYTHIYVGEKKKSSKLQHNKIENRTYTNTETAAADGISLLLFGYFCERNSKRDGKRASRL